jgi:hypothetical protein
MTLIATPVLATSIKAFARSVLFSLGVDHVLMDFLAHTAIGAATVLLALLFVGIRIPRRSKAAIRDTTR